MVELHRYFKKMRDKHVVHSVSPLETFDIGVNLVEEADGSLRVERMVTAQWTHGHAAAETVETLGNLAGYVRGFVQRRFEEAARVALEKAEEMSQEQLRNLPKLQPDPGHNPSVVRSPRPRPGPSSG